MAEWENRLGQESPLSRALRLAPEDFRNPLLHPEAVNHFALPPQQPRAELRNPAPRPGDYLSPVSEALSPTMGAYGFGNALGDAYVQGREGNYKGMASPLAEILLSMAPIPGAKARYYHGTPNGGFKAFEVSPERSRTGNNGYKGVSLTDDPNKASMFANGGSNPAVYPVHAEPKNPYVIDMANGFIPEELPNRYAYTEALEKQGYDALKVLNNGKLHELVMFDPKSLENALQAAMPPRAENPIKAYHGAIDRAVSIAQEVPQGERWEMRRSPQQRVIDEAKASGLWPEWGDAHPDRAVASAQEQMARREWDAVVNPIMYPYGSRAMSRDAAEAIAMQTHPELGLKYQDARRAWLEFDKQRELTPGEAMWEGLDRAPGVEPPSAAELMNVYGREKFMMVGHPELGQPKQPPQALANALAAPLPPRVENPIKAYHGSPRSDINEFATPAFFSKQEGVARTYRDEGGGLDNLNGLGGKEPSIGYLMARYALNEAGDDLAKARTYLQSKYVDGYNNSLQPTEQMRRFHDDALAGISYLNSDAPKGGMYEVALPEPTAHFTGNQAQAIEQAKRDGHKVISWGPSGNELIALDKGVIDILRKYGLLGPVAAGATANALMGDKDQQ